MPKIVGNVGGNVVPQGVSKGVKLIKIHRYDNDNNDQSFYLENLQNISFNYSDAGLANYTIVSTKEYDDYFLFGISPTGGSQLLTSSADDNVLDYVVQPQLAPNSSDIVLSSSFKGFTEVGQKLIGTSVAPPLPDTLNYFGTVGASNSGRYRPTDTPNTRFTISNPILFFTLNGATGQSGAAFVDIQFIAQISGDALGLRDIILDKKTVNLGGASYPYDVDFTSNAAVNPTFNVGAGGVVKFGARFFIASGYSTTSVWGTSRTPSTYWGTFLIAPRNDNTAGEIESSFQIGVEDDNFNDSDYNPFFNNVEDSKPSSKYYKVDYNGSTVPTNLDLILNEAALKAEVNDYYYSLERHTRPRYKGSKYEGLDFNLSLYKRGDNLPSAERNGVYFAKILGAGGQSPEYINKTFFFTDKLIDVNSNVFDSKDPDFPQFIDYKHTFEEGKYVDVNINPATPTFTGYTNLTGRHKILRLGTLKTLLVTGYNTGSLDYVNNGFVFENTSEEVDDSLKDFRFVVNRNTDQVLIANTNDTILFNTTISEPEAGDKGFTYSSGIYTFNITEDSTEATVKFKANLTLLNNKLPSPSEEIGPSTNYTVTIFKNSTISLASTTGIIPGYNSNTSTPGEINISLESPPITFIDDDNVRVQIDVNQGLQEVKQYSNLQVTQNPSPENIISESTYLNPVTDITSTAYTSSPTTFLCLSEGLSENYGNKQILSSSQTTFGYSQNTISPFTPQPGDEIRFGYNEDNMFRIVNVFLPTETSTGRLYLQIDRETSITGSSRNHFLIRTFLNDNAGMTLDVKKEYANPNGIDGTTKSSTIKPQYISNELKQNFSNIVRDLTNEGVL